MSKPGLLTLTIKDKSALYLAYMPYVVANGGLFIPTNSSYRLGDEVFMLLNLMGEEEKIPVAGTVIWMTPKGAQGKANGRNRRAVQRPGPGQHAEEDREPTWPAPSAATNPLTRCRQLRAGFAEPVSSGRFFVDAAAAGRRPGSRARSECRHRLNCAGRYRNRQRISCPVSSVLILSRMKYSGILIAPSRWLVLELARQAHIQPDCRRPAMICCAWSEGQPSPASAHSVVS